MGNWLAHKFAAVPWRFATSDYEDAVLHGGEPYGLRGNPVAARWDPGLGATMQRTGAAIFEEQVAEVLIKNLEVAGPGRF